MNASMIPIRDSRLYVEQYNNDCEEVLLYLHGGPGASCIDFCHFQAKALSKSLRVVALDQRGVLRSDPIQDNEPFGLNDILYDVEELRIKLNIKKWNVLGHSFGGMLAVKYAIHHPESIKKIIFETPCFDIQSSARLIITNAGELFSHQHNQDGIDLCNTYLNGSYDANELWNGVGKVFQALGDDKDLLYFHGITPQQYNEIIDNNISSNDLWMKNTIHNQRLMEEGVFFENLMPKLSQLSKPTILFTGAHDPVCCKVQQEAYLQEVTYGQIVNFENSAHFPRLEEEDKYTSETLRFIFS